MKMMRKMLKKMMLYVHLKVLSSFFVFCLILSVIYLKL